MKKFMKTKAGVLLFGFSVLAVWMLLAAQPGMAHTTNLTPPSCSDLPADEFLAATNTAPITEGGVYDATTVTPKQGTDLTDEGDRDFFYAKITVPPLTAGELRVFDTDATDGPSDAVLCHGRTTRVTSRTTYTQHDLSSTVKSAEDAAMKAEEEATSRIRPMLIPKRRPGARMTTRGLP